VYPEKPVSHSLSACAGISLNVPRSSEKFGIFKENQALPENTLIVLEVRTVPGKGGKAEEGSHFFRDDDAFRAKKALFQGKPI
jgi:hypothetical protein